MRTFLPTRPSRLPPLAVPLLGVVLVLVAFGRALDLLGTSSDKIALAIAGAAATFLIGAFNTRIQELIRLRPRLDVATRGADDAGRIVRDVPAPWPFDEERIVANEVAAAAATVRAGSSILDVMTGLPGLGSYPPSAPDHERARKRFAAQVVEHEVELRKWLSEYRDAARARHETIDLELILSNRGGAAHAETVTVRVDLPDGVQVVDAPADLALPPAQPIYVPPRARDASSLGYSQFARIAPTVLVHPARTPIPSQEAGWKDCGSGRRWELAVGEVQPGRSLMLGEPMRLRVPGPGTYDITWSVFSKSLSDRVVGRVALVVVAGDRDRPPFGRLEGILRYPDVPITPEDVGDDEDGVVLRRTAAPPRRADPPLAPHASDADLDGETGVLAKLRAAGALGEWRELGLNPHDDHPPPAR